MGLRDKIKQIVHDYAQQSTAQANAYNGMNNGNQAFALGTILSISSDNLSAEVLVNGQVNTVDLDSRRTLGIGDTVYIYNGTTAQ